MHVHYLLLRVIGDDFHRLGSKVGNEQGPNFNGTVHNAEVRLGKEMVTVLHSSWINLFAS